MQVWVLTIWLVGTTITIIDPNPFPSLDDCKKEGLRQVRWYQQDHIQAHWECENREHDIEYPPEQQALNGTER